MFKNQKMKKTISAVLSALMVLTMIPAFVFSTSAEDTGSDAATKPVSVSGEWEHQTITEGDYVGYGTRYISIWFKNTDFVFMQTKDNEAFELDTELSAMKNDGINTCQLTSVSFADASDLQLRYKTFSWTETSTCYGTDDPTEYTLPGTFGSGYASQLANNVAKWSGVTEFNGEGSATYNAYLNIAYKSGSTGYTTGNYSTAADDELIHFTVTVVDLRTLINQLAVSRDMLNNNTSLSEAQKAALSNVIENIDKNYTLDGTVKYTQEQVDSLTENLKSVTYADYTEYNKAVAKAEIVAANENFSEESRNAINSLLANKDTVLSCTVSEQATVDAATDALNKAISDAAFNVPDSMNTIDNTNPATSATYTFTSSSDTKDNVNITLSKTEIYMDVSEDINDIGLTYTYQSDYGKNGGWFGINYWQNLSGPLSKECLGSEKKQIVSDDSPANYDACFQNYGVVDSSTLATIAEVSKNASYSKTYALDGKPVSTTGNGQTVYLGVYATFNGNNKSSTTESSDNFTLSPGVPSFTLYVSDKAPLKTALQNAVKIQNDAKNYNEFLQLINNGLTVYGTRAVTETQVQEITEQLNNFEFTYSATASVSPENGGTVSKTLVSGTDAGNDTYTAGSVVTITALPNADYDFTKWSDDNTSAVRNETVSGNINLTAYFTFVLADCSELDNILASVPDDATLNKYYSAETVTALKQAISNAQAVKDAGYGKSNQALVDAAASGVSKALSSLVQTVFDPCDYTTLDNVLSLTNSKITENDGRYTDGAWKAYQDALAKANAVDRNLTQRDGNQEIIDGIAVDLNNALNALDNTANQNGLCDYSTLDSAKEEAAKVPTENDGRYTTDAWNEFKQALADANNVQSGMYNDTKGVNQGAINSAAEKLSSALKTLNDTKNFVVEVKDTAGETAATIIVDRNTETTFGDIKDKITTPETPDTNKEFVGFKDQNDNLVTDSTVITGDTVLTPVFDEKTIIPNTNSQIVIDRSDETVQTAYTYMVGLTAGGNTAAEVKEQLQNDSTTIIIIRDNAELSGTDLVGTGCIVKCVSKADHTKVYEQATVILYGDVDGNGKIDDTDSTKILNQSFANIITIADGTIFKIAGDLNGDGVIDGFDYSILDLQLSGVRAFDQTVTLYK